MGKNVAIAGVTGAVGREFLAILVINVPVKAFGPGAP